MAAVPETTLEELLRVREEIQGMSRALMALCLADDAYRASYKAMMGSPLRGALDESEHTGRLEHQRAEAVTLCVELGRSLLDQAGGADGVEH